MTYNRTLTRVEDYFDRTATQTWARLTSDAPVSRIRATVRAGRDEMRAMLLGSLPADLTGARVLDAGCGAGQMTAELAARGADVVAVDISPSLIDIAKTRLPDHLRPRVSFASGDMLDPAHGHFDHVVAMDSLIYYTDTTIAEELGRLVPRVMQSIAFTVAPRTTLLMAMWRAGKLFPRSDRAPVMVPHCPEKLASMLSALPAEVRDLGRVHSGFYISHALEVRP
ncbi:magnesium protoporphyrin IX methyltransferase [Meridianimarinicoccus aquatilis]|uniref:Magnesium protoporphyrin IX methyltransferase n=1 Tax=Meridianimarinicoccus aquatilis TaxID=2552766 RepID=A0A4R6ARD9_9RHOB|nr:magnesium protoporphyrin IX methyltransferase [Fluviibacterium aquatile]TDL86054.1 magnesium protoporphyrin IX methyltransferase [Fluviibacterium aquatile]